MHFRNTVRLFVWMTFPMVGLLIGHVQGQNVVRIDGDRILQRAEPSSHDAAQAPLHATVRLIEPQDDFTLAIAGRGSPALVDAPRDRGTLYSVQTPPSARAAFAAGATTEAIVYYAPVDGPEFGLFLNYGSSTGSVGPAGTWAADNLTLGAGFKAGGMISSYELRLFRSSLDPGVGPADIHVELWDGDPLCQIDTPGAGYACAPIPGSGADFVGLKVGDRANFKAVLGDGVTAPHQRVWMVVSAASGTPNGPPCRLGWIISPIKPRIGSDEPGNFFEEQRDEDGRVNGGTCCIDGSACNETNPICAFCRSNGAACLADADCPAGDTCISGADDFDRGFCSDGNAETAGLFAYSGSCQGDPSTDFCSNFVAKVFTRTEITISLVPVSATGVHTISGNEIVMEPGQIVTLETRLAGWGIRDGLCLGGVNDGAACTSDADCADACVGGTNAGGACTLDSDCPSACSGGTNNGLFCDAVARCPGGQCHPGTCSSLGVCGSPLTAWEVEIDSSGYTSGLQGTLIPFAPACTTDEECAAPFGRVCSFSDESCVMDTDCPFAPFETCNALSQCDMAHNQCAGVFFDTARPDYVFLGLNALGAYDTWEFFNGLNFRIAAVLVSGSVPDPGVPLYGATLVLQAAPDARGTFTLGFKESGPNFLLTRQSQFIQPVGLIPARITVESDPLLLVPKNRYLTITAGEPRRNQAIRVTFVDQPAPFDVQNGQSMWVGAPFDISENGHLRGPDVDGFANFKAATLKCDPFFMDWSTIGGVVQVYDADIVPGGRYQVDVIDEGSPTGSAVSSVTVLTSPWGDLVGPFDSATGWTAPDGSVDITFDVLAMLDTFRSLPGAPRKVRVDVEPAIPDAAVNITDVVLILDAFRGLPYPFAPGPPRCP